MSLKHGLNLRKAAAPKKSIWNEPEEQDDDEAGQDDTGTAERGRIGAPKTLGLNLASKPKPVGSSKSSAPADEESRQDASTMSTAKARVKAAEKLDPSIFDYDSFHDAKSTVNEAKKAAARQDAVERKPKYINNLLDAASRRKQDQQVAREKLLQRERQAEGDEFADKDKFVTGAYKQQQEETRQLQEEEKRKAEEEEKRKRHLGGGMQGFYRTMMDQNEKQHQDTVEAAARLEKEGGVERTEQGKMKSDVELAAEMKARGVDVHLNEEGQVVDKRELLSAGLNVIPSGKSKDARGADHLRTSARSNQSAFSNRDFASQQAQRERQSRMLEEQLVASAKRRREEEEEQRVKEERESKSKKTDKDVGDAKARYLARKAARERGEG